VVATTLCGYTPGTQGTRLPALELVASCAASGAFAICEGGVGSPDDLRAAFAAGAQAVVVGTALTNLDLQVRRFAAAAPAGPPPPEQAGGSERSPRAARGDSAQ